MIEIEFQEHPHLLIVAGSNCSQRTNLESLNHHLGWFLEMGFKRALWCSSLNLISVGIESHLIIGCC